MKLFKKPLDIHLSGRRFEASRTLLAKLRVNGFVLLMICVFASQTMAELAEPKQTNDASAPGVKTTSKTISTKTTSTKTTTKNTTSKSTPKHASRPRDKTFMKREWGVEVMFVRSTSAGYMLEFRYKVLDPVKAKPLFERRIKPVLTHEKTGAKMIVPTPPTTGALRNSNPPRAGKIYWMFFANPTRLVKAGDKVDIAIGNFHADGIVVQ
jgi:hypothetical protein